MNQTPAEKAELIREGALIMSNLAIKQQDRDFRIKLLLIARALIEAAEALSPIKAQERNADGKSN